MAMAEAPCMKGGTGETSYTNNSIVQRSIIIKVRPMLEENIRALIGSIINNYPGQCLTIADLGCSSGPNTLAVLESIIDVALSTCKNLCRPIPEFNLLVNDLPQNDFNTVFKSLPGFYRKIKEDKGIETGCFVSGTPGSFHGRLFPNKSVHFMHSSTSLHFLSQVWNNILYNDSKHTTNLGYIAQTRFLRLIVFVPEGASGKCICASKGISPELVEAYKGQFGKDFNVFLRSKEIVTGGRMFITLPCTNDGQALPLMEVTIRALNKLESQGLIDKESLDTFNIQVYMPRIEQVKQVIEEEGSFILDKEFAFTMTFHDAILMTSSSTSSDVDTHYTAKVITNTIRAGCENLIATQFGEEILDTYFSLLQEMFIDDLNNGEEFGNLNLALSLIAKEEQVKPAIQTTPFFKRSIIRRVRPLLEESIRAVIVSITTTNPPEQCLTIADLGCSSGPNTLAVLESIIDVTLSTCNDLGRPIPEFNMLVNDLPQNDFNTVFKSLPGFYKKIKKEKGRETGCFVSGTPGSFHGRLFPGKTLHFIHSSTSLHFLSQMPKGLNGGCICADESTPAEIVEAYKHQFAEDLNMFLRCRSKELVDGGRMLLTLPCSHDGQTFPVMDLIKRVLNKIASQVSVLHTLLVDKDKLTSYILLIFQLAIPFSYKHIKEWFYCSLAISFLAELSTPYIFYYD
ncbi:LOW QUALITY PROTEIN: hypothetical protein V2J09_002177 [Rumex salicifolius]